MSRQRPADHARAKHFELLRRNRCVRLTGGASSCKQAIRSSITS
jgi:hypothetical protein